MLKTTLQRGQVISLTITDLADSGDGVGRYEEMVVFVPNTVPQDRLQVKLTQVKPTFALGEILNILRPSPYRLRPRCIVADKCGGCQWQTVDYGLQLEHKQNQVIQALQRIGNFSPDYLATVMQPILPADDDLFYRNKATYPLRLATDGKVKAGYYQKGSHKLINLNQCPVQDQRLDPFLAEVKFDIERRGWTIYNEITHEGALRHLGLRIGRRTGEVLLTLVSKERNLPELATQAELWQQRYPNLVGVLLNHQPQKSNVIFGKETLCITGRDYLVEEFAGLTFHLRGDTFFQVYTEQAEKMVYLLRDRLALTGKEILLDAYGGIGTLALPLAQYVGQVIAMEIQPQATAQAERNAQLNDINNATFYTGKVEELLSELTARPDVVILDPPRKGCESKVISYLREYAPPRIVYVSCNAATQARDLERFCADGLYKLVQVQPIDFFPQTSHVESVAFLNLET
jgi:23S rRNA (uracil1939-C5)-methyltransferase